MVCRPLTTASSCREGGKQLKSFMASPTFPWALLVLLLLYIVVDKSVLSPAAGWRLDEASAMNEEVLEFHGRGLAAVAEEPVPGNSAERFLSSDSSSGAGNHSAGHQHDAMLFLFIMVVLGTGVTHLNMHPKLHWMQQTVVLFVLGMLASFFQAAFVEIFGQKDQYMWGRSYDMWMMIDPHLLLFTLLPALLAGDAMNIDTAIARRVAKQCIYLATVGVVINGMLTALFLWYYLPYDWSFLLSLTVGSILCATDPVAVVALLKELGAPPTLTVQIQGESLLNDGTAIVLYTLAYDALKGESYDATEVIIFLARTALGACGLGFALGWIFYCWIAAAYNKLEEHSSMVQISLSLSCAYWSFILAEGVLQMSGVLACVISSLVLADKMWPVITSKESMHTVWHVFEYLGNSVIFFLAGALTGKIMVKVEWSDYLNLIVVYLVINLIRFGMLLLSKPILGFFGKEFKQTLTVADIMVMAWGGLRGAVGLTLAIQVTIDKAGGKIANKDADRVLFYVGGVAALTLVVNATTAPILVRWLGVANLPETKQRILLMIHDHLFRLLDEMTQSRQDLQDKKLLELERVMNHMEDRILAEVKQDKQQEEEEENAQFERALSRKNTRTGSVFSTISNLKDAASAVMMQKNVVKAAQPQRRVERSGSNSSMCSVQNTQTRNWLIPRLSNSSQLSQMTAVSHRASLDDSIGISQSETLGESRQRSSRLTRLNTYQAGQKEIVSTDKRSSLAVFTDQRKLKRSVTCEPGDAEKTGAEYGDLKPRLGIAGPAREKKTANRMSLVAEDTPRDTLTLGSRDDSFLMSSGETFRRSEKSSTVRSMSACSITASFIQPFRTEESDESLSVRGVDSHDSLTQNAALATQCMRAFPNRQGEKSPSKMLSAQLASGATATPSDCPDDDQSCRGASKNTLATDATTNRDVSAVPAVTVTRASARTSSAAKRKASMKTVFGVGGPRLALVESDDSSDSSSNSGEEMVHAKTAPASTVDTASLLASFRQQRDASSRLASKQTMMDKRLSSKLVAENPRASSKQSAENPREQDDVFDSEMSVPVKKQSIVGVTPVKRNTVRESMYSLFGGNKFGIGEVAAKRFSIMSSSWSMSNRRTSEYSEDGGTPRRSSVYSISERGRQSLEAMSNTLASLRHSVLISVQPGTHLLSESADLRAKVNKIPEKYLRLLGDVPTIPSFEKDEGIRLCVTNGEVDAGMLWATNEALLNLVYSQYWNLIENGDVIPGTKEAEILLTSVKLALSNCRGNLADIKFIKLFVQMPFKRSLAFEAQHIERLRKATSKGSAQLNVPSGLGVKVQASLRPRTKTRIIIESTLFNGSIMAAIVLNAVFWVLEEQLRKGDNEDHISWLIVDSMFTLIFLLEFSIKFLDMRCNYFRQAWNQYDFFVVAIGFISVSANARQVLFSSKTESSSNIIRAARIFRILRVLRVFKLVHVWQVTKARLKNKAISLEVAERVQKISVLTCFVKAHVASQNLASKFFGKQSLTEVSELAHSVLQSQVSCFKAMVLAVREQQQLDMLLLEQVHEMRLRKSVAENLQSFVVKAHHAGMLGGKEAESLLIPLKEQIKSCNEKIKECHLGMVPRGGSGDRTSVETRGSLFSTRASEFRKSTAECEA